MKHARHLPFSILFLAAGFSGFAEEIPTQTIAETWMSYGKGVVRYQNRMLFLQEAEDSKGVGVMSPKAYGENVILRYELMPMNPASVCVAFLSASNKGEDNKLTLPEGYDGSLGLWTQQTDNYFFAFHNMAHDRTPFSVRFPVRQDMGEHKVNVMRAGEFATIEVGRRQGTVWLSINGTRLFEGVDPQPLKGGHLGFRIRGINGMAAACLIRNVTVISDS